MAAERKGKLFDEPQGPSKQEWATAGNRYDRAECEACGTVHHAEEGVAIPSSMVGGVQIVDECCGAYLDKLYEDLGEDFFNRRSAEFRHKSLDAEYGRTRMELRDSALAWHSAADKQIRQADATVALIPEE